MATLEALWLALHLPHLPLQALPWARPGLDAALPVAVAEGTVLLEVNRAARALGVKPGMSRATAASLAPQLLSVSRDPEREAALVRRLALALGALSPNVCLEASGVLLEVRASLRLFGGLRALMRRALILARELGLQVRLASAPGASAAWLLATSRLRRRRCLQWPTCRRLSDRLPVGALAALLPLGRGPSELLQALGVHRLDALRALPRAGLQRRLGRELGAALDRLGGHAPDPRAWLAWPERFEARLELLQRADDAAVLEHAVGTLLPALEGWLRLRWHGATVLTLTMRHEHGHVPVPDSPATGAPARTPEPAPAGASARRNARAPLAAAPPPQAVRARAPWPNLAEPAPDAGRGSLALAPAPSTAAPRQRATALSAAPSPTPGLRYERSRGDLADTVLRLQLSTPCRDRAQFALLWRERLQRHALAAPVYEIRLALEASQPDGGTPGELIPGAPDNASDHATLAALWDRLVARLGPERVQRHALVADHRPERAQRPVPVTALLPRAPAAMAPLPRPTWLVEPPEPLGRDAHGRPLHGGPLKLLSRAERIEAGWFDGLLVRRDYHVAEGRDHRLRWIFREQRSDAEDAGWFLHGWFG